MGVCRRGRQHAEDSISFVDPQHGNDGRSNQSPFQSNAGGGDLSSYLYALAGRDAGKVSHINVLHVPE